MLKEEKIKSMIEEELQWLKTFTAMEKTNIYRDDIVEVDRRIQRVSAFYEVLEEAPNEEAMDIVKVVKEKLQ